MWRLRGRTQLTIATMTLLTLILILYRMSASDMALPASIKENHIRHLNKLDENGDSATLIHMSDQLARHHAYDARILADVQGYQSSENQLRRNNMHINSLHANGEQTVNENISKDWHSGSSNFKGQIIVHLDLKGAPPRVSYYAELFPLLRELGATGILMEYEDMFPFSGPQLQDLPAYNAYSKSDIKQILSFAESSNLQVIPLVQTFGHLEFLLKLQKFAELREVPKYPQVICPTHNATFDLLTAMIDQVVALHPGLKYLHIGCDEVYYLGECVRCGLTMVDHQWGKKQLFLHHVTQLAKYIREKYPSVVPLTWDDEFRELPASELMEWGIAKLLEPVIWKYTPDVANCIPPEIFDKYSAVFPAVWIASAFKGATGSDKYITDISYHVENHRSWMELVSAYSEQLKFRGIFITGWQRYDHFGVLCELLPVGIPSLAMSIAHVRFDSKGMSSASRRILDILKCDGVLPMSPGSGRTRCNYPGSPILEAVERLHALHANVDRMMTDSTVKGWMTSYNILHVFSSPSHVEHATADLDRYKMELFYIERDMKQAMSDVYDRYTITEWISTYLQPLEKQLQSLWDAREKFLSRSHWPKRPLDILKSSESHDL